MTKFAFVHILNSTFTHSIMLCMPGRRPQASGNCLSCYVLLYKCLPNVYDVCEYCMSIVMSAIKSMFEGKAGRVATVTLSTNSKSLPCISDKLGN